MSEKHWYVVHYHYKGASGQPFIHNETNAESLKRSLVHLKNSKHFQVTKVEHIVTTTLVLDETAHFLGGSES